MMINSLSNFKESPIATLPGTAQLKAGSSFSEGRGAGLGWQGLFGGLRRKEQQRRCCDFFQQFLGLSRRSQPLPPEAPPPLLRRGAVSSPRPGWLVFFCCDLFCCWEDIFPKSPYRRPRLDDPLSVALGGPHYCGGVERRGRDG